MTVTTSQPYTELSLKSRYVDDSTLSHTLWVRGSTFVYNDADLTLETALSYLAEGGDVLPLAITGYKWGSNHQHLVFYTNNPFDLAN
jgi:hypothetical protein